MPRILVVDDDQAICDLLLRAFGLLGYDLAQAKSGSEALRRLHHAPAHLVIADIFMPNGSGLDLIRTLHHECPRLKFFFITGAETVQGLPIETLARSFGALRLFKKPLDVKAIVEAAKEVLFPIPNSPA
ncbi:MAG: response regulator [Nitrospirales bacterium]